MPFFWDVNILILLLDYNASIVHDSLSLLKFRQANLNFIILELKYLLC